MNLWILFFIIVFGLLAVDLFVFNRRTHEIKMREAIKWTVMWVVVAMLFAVGVWYFMGAEKAGLFLTAYIVEKSLSVDNLFVFILIFGFFKVDVRYHHKVLYWGILGALITRGIFIFAGVTIVSMFHFVLYFFGAFLVYTAYKLIAKGDSNDDVNPNDNYFVRWVNRHIGIKTDYIGSDFVTKASSTWMLTPLFVVLVAIETTDVMFAFDSIPAVLSITQDTFIVYTSNVFAILGLRALYFVIADIMPMFQYLKYGLAIVLGFIGIKMLVSSIVTVPTVVSLLTVIVVLGVSIMVSIAIPKHDGCDIE